MKFASKRVLRAVAIMLATVLTMGTSMAYAQTPSGLSNEEFAIKAENLLKEKAGKEFLGAAIVVFSNDGILFSKGFGAEDIANKRLIDAKKTGFEYGSVTKTFVWLSVMQLAEEGKIKLDEDISNYLPNDFYSALKLKWPITTLDLMNHRAGFEEAPLDMILKENEPEAPLKEALIKACPVQRFNPGTVTAYSNFGCALAGYIVECVSHKTFSDYLNERFFVPLKMTSAGLNGSSAKMAEGSMPDESGSFINTGLSRVALVPAGAARGTAEDLAKLGVALLNRDKRIFKNQATFDMLFSDSFAPLEGMDGVAHGLFTMNAENGKGYQHPGNTNGFTAQISVVPEQNIGYVLLSNTAYANAVNASLNRLLMGGSKKIKMPSDAKPAPQSGYYVSGRNAFNLPYYSLLSYVNTYHLKTEGDYAFLTSALMRIAGFFGADDMGLKAIRETGSFYRVENHPEMVETLYLETRDGIVDTVWTDGDSLIPIEKTPVKNYNVFLLLALTLIILMAGFIISAFIQLIIRVVNAKRHKKRDIAPFILTLSGAAISAAYFAGLNHIAENESPAKQAINGFTACLLVSSIAVCLIMLYIIFRTVRDSKKYSDKRIKTKLICRSAAVVLLIILLASFGQYHFL